MMYYFKFLSNVCGPNEYCVESELHFQKSNTQDLYFQLYKTNCSGELIRYIPQGDISNTVTVLFASLDEADTFERVGVQAFVGDLSIYKVTVGPSDCVSFGGFEVQLDEVNMVTPPNLTPTQTKTTYFKTATDLAIHLSGQKSYRV